MCYKACQAGFAVAVAEQIGSTKEITDEVKAVNREIKQRYTIGTCPPPENLNGINPQIMLVYIRVI